MHKNSPLIPWIVCFMVLAIFGSTVQPFFTVSAIPAATDNSSDNITAPVVPAVAVPLKVDASVSESTQTSYEASVLKLINAERVKRGLNKLKLNTKLRTAARRHSKDMATKDFFSHTGSNGSSMTDRITKAGYKWAAAGETLYAGGGEYKTPQQCVNAWLNSPGHANIMLSATYTQVGIGYYYDKNSPYGGYYTADFGKPR